MKLDDILRCLAGLTGAAFLYCGCFLYEKEENELHNRLDGFWKTLDLKSQTAISYHANKIQLFSFIAFAAIIRICGNKVWSLQNFFANVCISVTSCTSFAIIGVLLLCHWVPFNNIITVMRQEALIAVIFTILFLLPLTKLTFNRLYIWRITVGVSWALLYVSVNGMPQDISAWGLLSYFNMLLVWVVIVACLMVLSRLCTTGLRSVTTKPTSFKSIGIALIYVALMSCTVFTLKRNCHLVVNADGHGTFYFDSNNIFVILFIALPFFGSVWLNFALFIFLSLALLIFHSVLWGSIKRPVYSLSRHKVFNKHKTLLGIGVVLISFGFHIPNVLLDLIRAI